METTQTVAQMLPSIGEGPRGEWKSRAYKPTAEELQAAFKAFLCPGCSLYYHGQPHLHLFFHEVDENGVSMHCPAWADQTPVRKTWQELWEYFRMSGTINVAPDHAS